MSAPEIDTREADTLAGALWIAEAIGARVLPVHHLLDGGECSCRRPDCERRAKHPIGSGWLSTASSDPAVIRTCWFRNPRANVGIVTGAASGVVVVDVDGARGELSLATLAAKHGSIPLAPKVRTARGYHLYFRAPSEPIKNRVGFADGLDFRGDGGFVVAPPSVHETGFRYAWEVSPADVEPPPLIEWLRLILTGEREREATPEPPEPPPRSYVGTRAERWALGALERECSTVRESKEGTRNAQLNTSAFNLGTIVGGGSLDAGTVRRSLRDAALEAGLGEFEALKTILSGMSAGQQKEVRSAPTRDAAGFTRSLSSAGAASSGSNGVAAGNGARAASSGEPAGPDDPPAQPKPPAPSAMRPMYDTGQLFAQLPEQRWTVGGLQIGAGRPTLFAGYGASAKTLASQQLALAVASGRPVWNRFETSPGVVLHIDYEQTFYATAKRYQRLALGHGIDLAELGDRIRYVEMPRAWLDRPDGEDEYLRACDGIDLVIVDALRGAAPHTDENDSLFRRAIDSLTYVSQRTGAAILVLHHAGKPKDGHTADARTLARGSSAIYDASGCVFNLQARPGAPARLVTQVKTPAEADGAPLAPFELVVDDVAFDGVPNAGVRVYWQEPAIVDVGEQAEKAFQHDAEIILKAIRRNNGKSSNAIVSRCGMPRARALEVLRTLGEELRVIVEPGPGKTKRYRLPTRLDGADE